MPQYVWRLGHFFAANVIDTDDGKRSIFLSVIGPPPHKLLRKLIAPNLVGKPFATLVEVMKKHYSPKPSEIVQRFRFHNQFRKAGVCSSYIAEL